LRGEVIAHRSSGHQNPETFNGWTIAAASTRVCCDFFTYFWMRGGEKSLGKDVELPLSMEFLEVGRKTLEVPVTTWRSSLRVGIENNCKSKTVRRATRASGRVVKSWVVWIEYSALLEIYFVVLIGT